MLRRTLHKAGLQKIHHPSFVDLLRHENIRTVLDVGANEGHYGAELRERGFGGRIVSFEPISAVFAKLEARSRADCSWDCYRLGVGNCDGNLTISVSVASVFSSFKAPSDYTRGKFVGAKEERRETVPVVRLDSFLADHPVYLDEAFLKIDTQGFEKEVLLGAGSLLERFRGVQLELPIRQLYADQDKWIPMVEWMAKRGFGVAMAKENGFDWDAMRLLELDVLFMRDARS
jgi:FkbM family methyltransferase